ncbi:MAG: PD-(D/E)XK nuclease family protein [Deltaproteobacteria bacterium]|nr:PD-(D/E)XK nuclease family protein [Deltaproteobacteria bacterium]
MDALTPPFDPLGLLGVASQEVVYTRFVAWLLDPGPHPPGQDHGLGERVVQLLARAVFEDAPTVGVGSVALWRERPAGDGVRATARAPDLRCAFTDTLGREHLLVFEHKVLAPEGDGQVRDYLLWARAEHPEARRAALYLTPDGRSPRETPAGERVLSWTWAELANTALGALGESGSTPEAPARAFARSVLGAWRARFGGDPGTVERVRELHQRHPREARRAASPGAFDDPSTEPLRRAHPAAYWYLQTIQSRHFPWTRGWVARVAAAFRGSAPGAPGLGPGAPHEAAPDCASWSLEGVSDALGLYVLCVRERGVPRLRVALRSPGLGARELLARRDQLDPVEAWPEPQRGWLLGARPVEDSPGSWRWLQLGDSPRVPRGFTVEDETRRVAEALHGLLGPQLPTLAAFARDPSQRLYAADLDGDHQQPVDARDREDLARDARPDARRVLVLLRQPTGHLCERRPEGLLGAAWSALYGGTGAFAYEYLTAPGAVPRGFESELVARLSRFDGPEDPTLAAALQALDEAVARGARVLLLGDRCDANTVARRLAATALGAPFGAGLLEGRLVLGGASPARVELAPRSLDGAAPSWVARWRAGASRVTLWAGGGVGPSAGPSLARPEVFARWWRALGEGVTLGGP